MAQLESIATNVKQPYTLWQEFRDLTTNEKRAIYSIASFLPETPLLFYDPLFEIGCGLMVLSAIAAWKYGKGHIRERNNNSSKKQKNFSESL